MALQQCLAKSPYFRVLKITVWRFGVSERYMPTGIFIITPKQNIAYLYSHTTEKFI